MAAQKWNLQDIRPAEPRKRRAPTSRPPREQERERTTEEEQSNVNHGGDGREHIPNIVIEDGRKKGSYRLIISIALFVLIVGGAVLVSALTGKTELTIYPQHREPNISAEFTAYPDQRSGELSYSIMTIESTQESQVAASGEVEVEEQATGVMEIVKTTPGAERLIAQTRFRSPDGLVYRIPESVVVPGAVRNEAGNLVPGTIQTEVFADEIGEEYNLAAGTEFDVPGFQEGGFTALYEAISGRNPEPITGGYDGMQFQIDDGELSTARQALQVELRDTLIAQIENERPAGHAAFPGSVAITYTQLDPVSYGDDLVTIKEQAILQMPIFETGELASFLAEQSIATYEGNPIRIEDPSTLSFSYSTPTTSSSVIANETSLTFTLSGKPLMVWEYDVDSLKRDLATLPKTAINNAVTAYPGIEGARVHITPFWQRTFPEDPEDITIIEKLRLEE